MTDPTRPPAPGDPRDPGPRPAAGWRDVAWAGLATVLVLVTTAQLLRLVVILTTSSDVAATAGRMVLGFVITVVWLLTIYWLVAGSWRRTVWGCPFDHAAGASAARRCQRHALVGSEPTHEPGADAPDRPGGHG